MADEGKLNEDVEKLAESVANIEIEEKNEEDSTRCNFIRWCSIGGFHNVVKNVVKCRQMREHTGEGFFPQVLALDNTVTYRGKVCHN